MRRHLNRAELLVMGVSWCRETETRRSVFAHRPASRQVLNAGLACFFAPKAGRPASLKAACLALPWGKKIGLPMGKNIDAAV
jgi:hypothetical protein